MADAKKCDRCGSFYDITYFEDTLYANELTLCKVGKRMYDVELCPECSEEFDNFMSGIATIGFNKERRKK